MRRPCACPTAVRASRARRGLAALSAVAMVTVIAALAVVTLQVREGRGRMEGRAFLVADVAAAEGRALHHWLHQAQAGAAFALPATGSARRLSPAETAAAEADPSGAPWRTPPRGWTAIRLVATPSGQGGPERAFGILVLRPAARVTDPQRTKAVSRLREAVDGGAAALAATVPGLAFNDARDIAVFAHPFWQLDTGWILREPRSGHPPEAMVTRGVP